MPGERRYGMDHEHYDWWPIVNRPVLRWPNHARVALCVIVNLEHLEWRPPKGSYRLKNIAGGISPRPHPEIELFSHREYGHRVGVFRVLDALAKHGIKATVAMDQLTADNYPYLVQYIQSRDCELIGHGVAVTRMITSRMSEEEEREYIRQSLASLRKATGIQPVGWFSPEYGESPRTPALLAEAGIRYLCDWVNDEQPYAMNTAKGQIYSLPIMLAFDDIFAMWDRQLSPGRYNQMVKEGFDKLYEDGMHSGRVLVLNIHPWLIGQPFRITYLDDALAYIVRASGVWRAKGSGIIDWYSTHPPGS